MKTLRYTNDGKQHDETKLNEMSNAYNAHIFVKRRQWSPRYRSPPKKLVKNESGKFEIHRRH